MARSKIVLLSEGVGVALLAVWLLFPTRLDFEARVPIPANDPAQIQQAPEEIENPGTLIPGLGTPSPDSGSWPQFRGADRTGIVLDPELPGDWFETQPRVAWRMTVGEGHAGAAIHRGRLYLVDYDEEAREDVIRCLSLNEGEEIWRYTYSSKIKRNHGMSRTVPAVNDEFLVTLGPRCQVHCLDPNTGELFWKQNLVKEYGARIPEWYAGQCPLLDGDRVILAPGGRVLMTAIDLATGESLWETPNDLGWDMTHASITPIEAAGVRQYVWNASGGVVGISAETGQLLWNYPDWRIKIANIPSPVDLGEGRILLSGGYNAGGDIIRIQETDAGFAVESVVKTPATAFGSDQHTPLFLDGFIYAVIPGGKLACLNLEGERLWVDEEYNFGLGPYLSLNGLLLVLDDNDKKPGELCLFEVNPQGAQKVASWKVIEGHDAWAPMAYAGGRLLLRDATTLVCLQLSAPPSI